MADRQRARLHPLARGDIHDVAPEIIGKFALADNAGELDSINTLLGAWGDFIDGSEPAWHGNEWFDAFLDEYLNEK